jgi:hypothetical protein
LPRFITSSIAPIPPIFGITVGLGGVLVEFVVVYVLLIIVFTLHLGALAWMLFFFNRRKYDAARTLAAFSATLRNEVDMSQLSEHLLNVVQETMQPAHISLWLRKTNQERHPNTRV